MCMDKKKIGLIVVILFLLVGLGTFVFANPNNEENLLKGEDNSGETLDDGENGTTEPTATPEVPGDDNTNRPTPAPTTTPEVTVPVNDGNNELPGGIGEAGRDPYEAAKAAVSQAESSLTQKDVDYAAGLVEQVTDLDLKKELLDRLFNVQNIIDATALVEQLEAMVQDATNVDEMDDARDYRVDSKVEEAVSNLVESDSKTDLLDRLSIVAKILDDKTSPVINGIKDNAYTNQSVSLTIEDENEVTMTVTLNETEIDFAETFDQVGTYVVTVMDAAKNEKTVTFTIDKTLPEVTGVENNGKYTNSVTPIVKDNNNKVMATLNGEPFVSGTTISAKGEYELIVKDEAGNEVIFKFSIVKIATVIEFVEPESLIYDGSAKEFKANLKDENGNIIDIPLSVVYEAEDGTRGNAINAGKYTAIAYFAGNDDYEIACARKSFEIERATPTIELVEPASLVYDGNKKEFGIKVLDVLGNPLENVSMNVIYKDATTNQELEEAPTNPGSYILGVYVRENENYTRADKWINFTIEGEILGTITVNGEKINFYSYDELFTKIPDNTETLVTLESNANQDITIPNNKNIILDLNNYVLNGDKTIINNGILSIKNGTINATNNGIINNNRIEDIDNVTINATRTGINNSNGTIVNIKNSKIEAVLYPIYNANYSTIGTLENNDVMGHYMDGIYVADNSTIYKIISGNYMSDGKSSTYGNVAGFGLYISTNATVNEIIGGVFKGSKAAVANYGSILAISGGTFEIKFNNDSWDLSNTFLYYGNVSNISGGKFYSYNGKIGFGIFRQNNYSLKDGYEFVKDGDYFIVQKSA